jgi:uncharacterized membrane protein required for colicin V production
MQPIDWGILALVVYNTVSGLFSGLWRSLTNLAALVCAFLLTPVLKPIVIDLVANLFQLNPYLSIPLGTSLTWTGIYVVISFAGLVWSKILSKTPLRIVDRLGGLALGLVISALLILVPLAAIRSLPFLSTYQPVQKALSASVIVPMLNPAVEFVRVTVGPGVLNYWLKQQEQKEMQAPAPSAKPGTKPNAPPKPRS